MVKKDLYYIRTNTGYGLFQEFDSTSYIWGSVYIVYYTQIKHLSEDEILCAMKGERYYVRLIFESILGVGFFIEQLKSKRYVEFGPKGKLLSDNDPYFRHCRIAYLGEYNVPNGAKMPRYSRNLELSYYPGKWKWYIHDEVEKAVVTKGNGRPLCYNRLTPDIASYMDYLGIYPRELLERFNADYRLEQDDKWVELKLEKFYAENPRMRPTDEIYDDIKYPYPTDNLRQINQDAEYREFCGQIDTALDEFIRELDLNNRAVRAPLIKLIKALSRVEKETGLIGSLEAEKIYEYIVRILRALKKARLIELLEAMRDW